MNNPSTRIALALFTAGIIASGAAWPGDRSDTEFSNERSIGNTRHNLTQQQLDGGGPTYGAMEAVRNNYGEICVYCHTPHGANQNINMPLWNRTVRSTAYTLYNQQSLTGEISQPGPNSLSCLSCHDGQTAVDSIINMPGSGKYNAALALDPSAGTSKTLLDAWQPNDDAWDHYALKSDGTECLSCHSVGGPYSLNGAQDFTVYALGTDLSNDHPVGVPLQSGVDWNPDFITNGRIKFLDLNGNARPDKNELRAYDSGQGYEVECASCHDPHGVPGAGGVFLPTFLRVTTAGSEICLTCHAK